MRSKGIFKTILKFTHYEIDKKIFKGGTMDKKRILATLIVLIMFLLIFFLILNIELINDKNEYILNLKEENQDLTNKYG